MTSKEALKKLSYIPIYEEDAHNVITDIDSCCIYKGDLCEVYGSEVDTIEKDLEILECFKKIDKKELKEFIETQIKYTLNENTWLSACNADLEKEKPTKHLIKIKEWLEDDNS